MAGHDGSLCASCMKSIISLFARSRLRNYSSDCRNKNENENATKIKFEDLIRKCKQIPIVWEVTLRAARSDDIPQQAEPKRAAGRLPALVSIKNSHTGCVKALPAGDRGVTCRKR